MSGVNVLQDGFDSFCTSVGRILRGSIVFYAPSSSLGIALQMHISLRFAAADKGYTKRAANIPSGILCFLFDFRSMIIRTWQMLVQQLILGFNSFRSNGCFVFA